jgi:uncharacterized protein YbbC (DUF1343 family)
MFHWLLTGLMIISVHASGSERVLQGIDQIDEIAYLVKDKKLALLAHFASVDQEGKHLVDLLFEDTRFRLKKVFTPEHGLRTLSDTFIGNGQDPKTKLPVYSLYQAKKKAPRQKDWEGVDAIIIDLKDVGVRYYTYNTSIYLTIESALKNNKRVILLDRVNPLGRQVSGPVKSSELKQRFFAYFKIPMNHGLTSGELMSWLFREDKNRDKIKIVTLKGWRPTQTWSSTQIPWIAPSPALPLMEQSFYYSIFGALESFNLAVGRGIDNSNAFMVFGAPWISLIDQKKLVDELNQISPEIDVQAYSWEVTRRKFIGQTAIGFKINIDNFLKIDRFKVLVDTVKVFRKVLGHRLKENGLFKFYIGDAQIASKILSGQWSPSNDKKIKAQLSKWEASVRPFLLYE